MNYLSRLTIRSSSLVADENTGLEVYHIMDQHVPVQTVGYIKYMVAKESGRHVFYRGEARIYQSLTPSLYRGIKNSSGTNK